MLRYNRYTYWDSSIESEPPSVHYDEIMADDKGVGAWTAKIVSCETDGKTIGLT